MMPASGNVFDTNTTGSFLTASSALSGILMYPSESGKRLASKEWCSHPSSLAKSTAKARELLPETTTMMQLSAWGLNEHSC